MLWKRGEQDRSSGEKETPWVPANGKVKGGLPKKHPTQIALPPGHWFDKLLKTLGLQKNPIF
jgi:hypothetical protein